MKKEINYGGFSANRSDYESEDGELAVSMGLVNEEGQLRHVLEPKKLAELPAGYEIVYIHKTAAYSHYILMNKRMVTPAAPGSRQYPVWDLYWMDESVVSGSAVIPVPKETVLAALGEVNTFTSEVREVNAVGNTLVVLADDGVHYVLWSNDDYKYLGSHLPEIELSFGLQAEFYLSSPWSFRVPYYGSSSAILQSEHRLVSPYAFQPVNPETGHVYDKEYQEIITNTIYAKINSFIEDKKKEGKFVFPFLVRYAYRLYDGSLTMHSSPVLMVTSSKLSTKALCFEAELRNITGEGSFVYFTNLLSSVYCDLDYCLLNDIRSELNKWSDIIKSIDIFVSSPIYTYKQDGKVDGWKYVTNDSLGYTISRIPTDSGMEEEIPSYDNYAKWPIAPLSIGYDLIRTNVVNEFEVECYSDDYLNDDVKNKSNFYLLHSIDISNLSTDRIVVSVKDGRLQTLETQEAMTDDYDSHDTLVSKKAAVYNNRLNLTSLEKVLATSPQPTLFLPYCNASYEYTSGGHWSTIPLSSYKIFVYIKQEGRELIVEGDNTSVLCKDTFLYIYYPNKNAYKVILYRDTDNKYFEFELKSHDFLNGACYFGGWEPPTVSDVTTVEPTPSSVQERTFALPNKIYTSEVDNPFYFPVEGINTIGTGQILAISTAAKALSQGQFGQFPLYAFTTEGVWALATTTEGTYRAVQPVTRDVLLDPESICQIDTAVLFATDRGVMVISGSESRCLSDVLLSEENFDPSTLPHLGGLLPTGYPTEIAPFREFVHGCRMVYDYIHQRIVVFNPTLTGQNNAAKYKYGYVFSLKSKLWGMTPTDLRTPLNSYPEALALTQGGYLVTLADSLEGADNNHPVQDALLVTRPLKLGDGNVFKSVHTLVQRGMFHRGNVKSILYASRDLWHWHLIGSSVNEWIRGLRGSGYKYFRIAVLAKLSKSESVSGATVEYELRETNRIH